jgi:hypothetical protein
MVQLFFKIIITDLAIKIEVVPIKIHAIIIKHAWRNTNTL